MTAMPGDLTKRLDLFDLLERMCQALEPGLTQQDRARSSYEAVGEFLAGSTDPAFSGVEIAPQGSVVLGTMTKPVGRLEYDVDLLCRLKRMGASSDPAYVKQLVGRRLKESSRYATMLEEKQRCWRLNYAGDFHLDITPSVENPHCAQGGELVPDRKLQCWKPTNPTGYRRKFEERAALEPQMAYTSLQMRKMAADSVEPFPENKQFKGILRRTVQLAKRHRDTFFLHRDAGLAPISVIITTLASQSYEYCVSKQVYSTGFDLLTDVLTHMTDFIDTRHEGNRTRWYIWNETTTGENFAEKWNSSPERAVAFFQWHRAALADVIGLADLVGLDSLHKSLNSAFGDKAGDAAIGTIRQDVSAAREYKSLAFAGRAGLALAPAAISTPVRANTFFGRHE